MTVTVSFIKGAPKTIEDVSECTYGVRMVFIRLNNGNRFSFSLSEVFMIFEEL
jgi:hypothetical protein